MIAIEYVDNDAAHDEDFVFSVPKGHDRYLLIMTRTPAIFLVEDELREYPAHCAVLYKPGQKIYYKACSGPYSNDWIRFATDETYVVATTLPFGEPFAIREHSYVHELVRLLVTEHIFNHTYKEITIDSLLRILFNKLLESYNQKFTSTLYEHLNALKVDIHNQPHKPWNVSGMAKQLNISKGHLELIYKETFGISCMDDVILSRIDLSKKYLLYSQRPVSEIASLSGYNSLEHFYRQFKRHTGLTPKQYRKELES